MRRSKYLFLSAAVLVGIIVLVMAAGTIRNLFIPFQKFSVTIHNESDYEIVSVETGIIKGQSKDVYNQAIKSGTRIKITPNLSLAGEGAVYLAYTDSNGTTVEKTVCGYTESLSGHSKITITNEDAVVEETCH